MNPHKKRKIVENSQDISDNENSSDANSDVESELGEIQASFEGRNLEDFDFHGIKQLLLQLFLKAHVDISQITDFLVNQNGIGSVLKQVHEDDDSMTTENNDTDIDQVYGVTTVLNLSSHKDANCIKDLHDFFKEQVQKHGSQKTQEKWNEVVNIGQKVGLLINERFLNIPASIAAPMFSSLYAEIKRTKKKNPSYDFQYFIMVCKTFRLKKETCETSFANDEETIFSTHADCSFEYAVTKESDTAIGGKWGSNEDEILPYRRVLLIPANKFETIIDQVKSYVQT